MNDKESMTHTRTEPGTVLTKEMDLMSRVFVSAPVEEVEEDQFHNYTDYSVDGTDGIRKVKGNVTG